MGQALYVGVAVDAGESYVKRQYLNLFAGCDVVAVDCGGMRRRGLATLDTPDGIATKLAKRQAINQTE